MAGGKEETKKQVNYGAIRFVTMDKETGGLSFGNMRFPKAISEDEADEALFMNTYNSISDKCNIIAVGWCCNKTPQCRLFAFHGGECELLDPMDQVGSMRAGEFVPVPGIDHVQ